MNKLLRLLAGVLLLMASLSAQGTADITVGAGPGTRSVDVDMSGVTGGSVTVSTSDGSEQLGPNSGTAHYSLPVGQEILIVSSSGKWWRIKNNGSKLKITGGTGGAPENGPDLHLEYPNGDNDDSTE